MRDENSTTEPRFCPGEENEFDGTVCDLKSLYLYGLFWQSFYFCQIWLAKVKGMEQDKRKKWMEIHMI